MPEKCFDFFFSNLCKGFCERARERVTGEKGKKKLSGDENIKEKKLLCFLFIIIFLLELT